MQTAWGEIEVCDAHVHFFSDSFFRALAAQTVALEPADRQTSPQEAVHRIGEKLGWHLPPSDPRQLAETWAQELDRAGAARAALIASIPGDEDSVAAAVEHLPSRFYGYFMLNAAAPDAAERAQRALSGGKLQGICLFPAMHRYSMHDARVTKILEIAASHPGTVVFVHCGVLTVGVRGKLGLPSPFDMSFSNPLDMHAVALQFPKLPFVVPHFGAGYFREALMLCDLCPNVYLDTSSTNSWMRYQPEALDLSTVFRKTLDITGAARLLFGTDSSFFPRGWHSPIFRAQSDALSKILITREDAQLIFGQNLPRLLSR